MPGPNPTPTVLKLLKGVKPYRINKNEPKPKSVSGNMPSGWGAHMPDGAKRFWKRYAPRLVDLGLLTEVDLDTFRILCELIDERKKLVNIIRKDGFVYKTKNQYWETMYKQRPEVGMKDRIDTQIYRYLQLFGMAPSSRSKISTSPIIDLDDDDDLD